MSEKTDQTLKTVRIRYWSIVAAIAVMIVSLVLWFFHGSYDITVTGRGQIYSQSKGAFFAPVGEIDDLSPGMQVWIGNSRGEITKVIYNEYLNYDILYDLYGDDLEDDLWINDRDMTYCLFYADVSNVPLGYCTYSVTVRTKTPFEHYFGGDEE